jgi:hypothetical protein
MESLSTDGGNSSSGAPASFADAFAADASPASTPSTPPTTTADAVVPPAAGDDTTPGQDRSPFIPRERFDAVHGERNTLKEWKEQHAWAETVDRTAVAEAQRIGQLFANDKPGFIREVLADAVNDPSLAPLVRSEAARLLGSRSPQAATAPPAVDMTPVPVQLENGQVIPLYTADQLGALKQQWMQEMRTEFAPAQQTAEQFQKAAQHYERVQQADGFAKSFYGDLSKLPGFTEHKEAIRQELGTTRLETDHPAEVRAAALAIYNRVVVPKLLAGRESKVLEDLQQRAHAATSVNPGSAAPSSPRAITSFKDLPADAWR